MFEYNKKLVGAAQHLRKSMTDEEKHLWYDFLSKLPIPAKRQKNIANYILDFYIPQAKIAIEVDGIGHTTKEKAEADAKRDAALSEIGITVLRYRNADVNKNFVAVAQSILESIREKGIDI